jgi:Tfp pilus assembly protein PilW
MSRRSTRGTGLMELLVGATLGLLVLGALTAAIGTGARLLTTAGARGEVEDIVQLAVEALTFDARRAGYDPTRVGVTAVSEARADRVTLLADLDGDGLVDGTSEETTAYVCAVGTARLSRVIGRQSLPLADGVTACAFRYLDASGVSLAVPASGLAAPERARIRAVALDLGLAAPGLRIPTARALLVALRVPG